MKTLVSALAATTLLALSSRALADCTSDKDCQPGFVCRGDGSCLRDPSQPATPPPAASSATPPAPPPLAAGAQPENTAAACQNGLDEDRDGHVDCGDQDCAPFVFCAQPPGTTYYPPAPPPGTEDPRAYRTERRGIKALLITGPILLGVAWLTTIGITVGVNAPDDINDSEAKAIGYACIPVAGPWAMLADTEIDTDDFVAPLVVSGVMQGTGLVLTVLGMTIQRTVRVPVGLSPTRTLSIAVAPTPVTPAGFGPGVAVTVF